MFTRIDNTCILVPTGARRRQADIFNTSERYLLAAISFIYGIFIDHQELQYLYRRRTDWSPMSYYISFLAGAVLEFAMICWKLFGKYLG